jgi:hypothetical protein
MNYKFTIAQPCFFKIPREDANTEPIIRPNSQKDCIQLEELYGIYEEVVLYHTLAKPIGFFTEVYKAIYDTETFKDYGYFLVAHNLDIRDMFTMLRKKLIWPGRVMAFGDNPPADEANLVTYDDNYVIVGLNSPKKVRLYRRRD